MTKEKLNTLLDSIYELEGLVHLAISRDDVPSQLPDLIRRKSRELLHHAEQATGMPEISNPAPEAYGATPETILSIQERSEKTEEGPVVTEEETNIAEVKPIVTEDNPYTPEEETDITEDDAYIPEDEGVVNGETSYSVQGVSYIADDEDDDIMEEDLVKDPEPVSNSVRAHKTDTFSHGADVEPRGRLVFSINDRYRFKRELFNSSDVDFNTTLSLVASMEGYDEAEDYFLNELQWDEKSPDVIDFLEILKNYFK